MMFDLHPPPPAPPPRLAILSGLLLCALFLFGGALQHDLWKVDDAVNLGLAYSVAQGHWLAPQLAGEPWLTPPLYHWLAALCGQLFSPWLEWHNAARLASVLFGAGVLALLALIARQLIDAGAALAAPLLAIGALGLLIPMHEAQPALAALCGWGLALLGLARWLQRGRHPMPSGALIGLGIGTSFLATGIDNLILPIVTPLVLLLHPRWRQHGPKATLSALALAVLCALILILPWPWLLYREAPQLFEQGWRTEAGRLLTHLDPRNFGEFGRNHLELLIWASWPLLPLALWRLWLERHRLLRSPTLLPLAATVLGLLSFFGAPAKTATLLPTLLPLTLLAAQGANRLRRGAANAFDWFGMMTFTLAAALIWLGAYAMSTGEPARIAKNFSKPTPDFIAQFSPWALTLAIAVSIAWIAIMIFTPRSPWRAAARWSIGLTALWILLVTLWLPWIDYGKSYRRVSADLAQALAQSSADGCIARQDLGPAQRASLDYFNNIRTVAADPSQAHACRLLIVQTAPHIDSHRPGWSLLRETSRPGDKSERLRLYRKD
ncbi:MAG TPA: glycosyltransferase family 39 protein [Rhodocyclaceae bacterium]|nr:glycosyltransferase family 39 protein [Rhodocyclaceae bacterium]